MSTLFRCEFTRHEGGSEAFRQTVSFDATTGLQIRLSELALTARNVRADAGAHLDLQNLCEISCVKARMKPLRGGSEACVPRRYLYA